MADSLSVPDFDSYPVMHTLRFYAAFKRFQRLAKRSWQAPPARGCDDLLRQPPHAARPPPSGRSVVFSGVWDLRYRRNPRPRTARRREVPGASRKRPQAGCSFVIVRVAHPWCARRRPPGSVCPLMIQGRMSHGSPMSRRCSSLRRIWRELRRQTQSGSRLPVPSAPAGRTLLRRTHSRATLADLGNADPTGATNLAAGGTWLRRHPSPRTPPSDSPTPKFGTSTNPPPNAVRP